VLDIAGAKITAIDQDVANAGFARLAEGDLCGRSVIVTSRPRPRASSPAELLL